MNYAELHCHSYYSFHDGASSLEELLLRTRELGYHALAITDHDNLCGVMRFAQLAHSLEMKYSRMVSMWGRWPYSPTSRG